jgi:hypothetical protein
LVQPKLSQKQHTHKTNEIAPGPAKGMVLYGILNFHFFFFFFFFFFYISDRLLGVEPWMINDDVDGDVFHALHFFVTTGAVESG